MIGTGHVGLVSGACFSDFGHDVICVDKDVAKIEALHRGVMPMFEPGPDELVERNVRGGRLSFTTNLGRVQALADAGAHVRGYDPEDMAEPIFIDLRNDYPPEDVEEAGRHWFGIRPAPRN
jgi:hypothetical protein